MALRQHRKSMYYENQFYYAVLYKKLWLLVFCAKMSHY